ncbi:MAG: enoyl-CoA hydratase-related protein [Peptoniphilaceae bacterium]|nr:enoyl-CoA hydratase-related protein [Peptoniphilaceae bacterium]MDY3075373.1 enoyl-CoA hydratase-related protein [Peptoniphilaceae bacterium]
MEFVQYQSENHIATITIDRPKALNALNTQVLSELEQVVDAIDVQDVYVAIITGAGEKSFVAGADIAQMSGLNEEEGRDFGEGGNRVFRKIETHPIPFIAAINGFALGGGNELAMSCDIRYASENAVFGQPEVGLGITPGFGGTQRLARVIGSTSAAKEILYSAKNIKAEEALRLGLVSKVVPQEQLMEEVYKLASRIASNAPIAVRNTKKAVNDGLEKDMDEAIVIEAKLFGACFATEDQKEGMNAFLEKRKEKNFLNK